MRLHRRLHAQYLNQPHSGPLVDGNGEPVIFYHGTKDVIEKIMSKNATATGH